MEQAKELNKKPNNYLSYPQEKRIELVNSIRAKQAKSEDLNEEEKEFLALSNDFLSSEEDNPRTKNYLK